MKSIISEKKIHWMDLTGDWRKQGKKILINIDKSKGIIQSEEWRERDWKPMTGSSGIRGTVSGSLK